MNRRSMLLGLLSLMPVAFALGAWAAADPEFVINDWTKGKRVPQKVRRSEIARCTHVNLWNGFDSSWVSVVTRDGRTIQSELGRNQDIVPLCVALRSAGVDVRIDRGPRPWSLA